MRTNHLWILLGAVLALAGCGGGGSGSSSSTLASGSSSSSSTSSSGTSSSGAASISCSSSGSNCLSIVVNGGPPAAQGGTFNIGYVSVTVCEPNTTNCAVIPNLQIDTGSIGLRIFASVLKNAGISLTPLTDPNNANATIGECLPFVDGYVWGPIATANVQMGGETANNLSVHVIDDENSYAGVPPACTALTVNNSYDSVAAFLANGTLGIGSFPQDCGGYCADCSSMQGGCTTTDDTYYSCGNASGTCTATTVATAQQVDNPISFFATDNNGSIVSLPAIPAGGQSTATGSLVFGIGTESNNALPSTAAVLTLDNYGFFTTTFNSQALDSSFLDSGSNAYFFADSSLPVCPGSSSSSSSSSGASGFYCPNATTTFTAINQGHDGSGGTTGNTSTVNFSIADLDTLTANNAYAYDNVGGTAAISSGADSLNGDFDFGLPFFYGRNVYTGIYGQAAVGVSGLTGPYAAYTYLSTD